MYLFSYFSFLERFNYNLIEDYDYFGDYSGDLTRL